MITSYGPENSKTLFEHTFGKEATKKSETDKKLRGEMKRALKPSKKKGGKKS